MSCCAPGAEAMAGAVPALPSAEELRLAGRSLGNGLVQAELSVPAVHCAACMRSVETALAGLEGVEHARVNLSTKRVTVRWREGPVPPVAETLAAIGYPPHLFDEGADQRDAVLSELILAVAVSGFAAGNIMLLSVSVWSGAEGATRDLFHLVSALIALPALVLAGRIYYRSAWGALRHGRMNMDVPIALGVSIAYAMSLYETVNSGPHAYFDAAVSLLFFLLIGRTLDHVMRNRARTAVLGLARLAPRGAVVLDATGARDYRPIGEIEPGMRVAVSAGDRIPVDGIVREGASDLDCSFVTGESNPVPAGPGGEVRAGTLNLTGPLTLEASARATDSFLAEMVRMMEAAEGGRARYRRIADRVSSLYSPVVHVTAAASFLGWLLVSGGDWHLATTIAVAVLIITCPCALGLAVPIVQVMAARRLFENGIMVRDGSAMERLAEADAVVFDKTGTLTLGRPRLVDAGSIEPEMLALAAELAAHSRHPLSRAIAEHGAGGNRFSAIVEHPGLGIEGRAGGALWRLGRASWACGKDAAGGTTLSRDGEAVASFDFEDTLRPGAREAVAALSSSMKAVGMLSGDGAEPCQATARAVGIASVRWGLLPAAKVEAISGLAVGGLKVAMVGDGLNDAPALGAAHVSLAPSSAADVGRAAADFVFLRDSLMAVPAALAVSRKAGRLIRQNLALAILYNAIAVPVAILGYVTPLVAAIAMSTSSLIVIANAMRLGDPAARSVSGTVPGPGGRAAAAGLATP